MTQVLGCGPVGGAGAADPARAGASGADSGSDSGSGSGGAASPDRCATNMGEILLSAGDLVGAYRYFQPSAERGDSAAIARLVDICERAGDHARADTWRERLPVA